MKKIILVSGDPNSINSEIIGKSWKKISNSLKKKIYLISSYNLIKDQFQKMRFSTKITHVKSLIEGENDNSLKIINVNLNYKNPFSVSKKNATKFIYQTLNLAHKISLNKNIKGLINCPINKDLFKQKKIGATEFFASKCKIKDNSEVMLIKNKNFAVSPITTHIDIKDVPKKIKSKIIFKKILNINRYYRILFNRNPRIGILGLNPHNSEMRNESEEKKIILPTVLKLKKKGINLNGPLVADTVFIKEYKRYDVIVGMYHDQVLAPFKSIFKFNAINLTLGLKYLRLSPDHGVAKSLIKKNKADPSSLIECIQFLNKFGL